MKYPKNSFFISVLFTLTLFSGCANLIEIKDWRILDPSVDLLKSPAKINENARQQANSIYRNLSSYGSVSQVENSKNFNLPESIQSENPNNLELGTFLDYPTLDTQKTLSATIFNQPKMQDTYSAISPANITLELLLDFYQKLISPQLGSSCPFGLSCSRYARKAVREFGPFWGSLMAIDRLLRCNRTAGNKYFIYFRRNSHGKLFYPLAHCFVDEPAANWLFK